MAHYAYKHVCYDIDYEKWKSLVKQYEEETGCEHDGDGNYDGDNWYVAERWIRELIAERDALKKDAERYRWLRATCDDYSRSDVFNMWEEEDLDAAIDAELEKSCQQSK